MKIAAILVVVGAALGAAVAVLTHFFSHTLPSTYYVGTYTTAGSNRVDQTLQSPLVHPSWLPVLPVSMIVGAVAGVLLSAITRTAGVQLTRHRPSDSTTDTPAP
jgi:uncharacterized membrane protein YoaK (UPF0700 family)